MAEDGQSDHIYSAIGPPVAKSKAAIYQHVQQTDNDGVRYRVNLGSSPGPPSTTPTPPPPPFHRSPSGGSGGMPEAMICRQSPEMGSYMRHIDSSRSSSRSSSAGRPSPRTSPAPPPAHTGSQRMSPASFTLSNHSAGAPLAVVSSIPRHHHHLAMPGAPHPALQVSPIPRITISPSPEMLAVSAFEQQQQQLNAALIIAAQQRASHPFPLPVPGVALPPTAGLMLDTRPHTGLTTADTIYLAGAQPMPNVSPHSKPPRLSPVSSAPTVGTDTSQPAPKLSPQYVVRLDSPAQGHGHLRRTPPPPHYPVSTSAKDNESLTSKPHHHHHHASMQRSSVSPGKLLNDGMVRHHTTLQPPAYAASHPVTLSSIPPPKREAVPVQKVLNQPIAHSTLQSSRSVENQTFFQRLQRPPPSSSKPVSSSSETRSHNPIHSSSRPSHHHAHHPHSSEAMPHKGRPPPVTISTSISAMPGKTLHTEQVSQTHPSGEMLAHPVSNLVAVTRTNHDNHTTTSASEADGVKHRTVSHPHSIEAHILNTTLSKTSKATVIPCEGQSAAFRSAAAPTLPSRSMQTPSGGQLAALDSAIHSYCRSTTEMIRPPIPNGEVHKRFPDQPGEVQPVKVEQTPVDSKEDWQPMVNFPFNMRVHNLNNFPAAQTSYRATYRSHNIAIHRSKAGCITSAAKSLDLLRQNLQQHINKELQSIIATYVDLFFKPGLDNIKSNACDDEIVSDDHINAVCRQVLEEAKKMYGAADVRSVTPDLPDNNSETGSLAENRSVREKRDRLFRIKRRRGSSDSEASVPRRKKKGRPPLHAVSGRSTPSKTGKSNEPVRKEGPKWDSARLKQESLFVMGARANKALGLGQTRGRIYIKHPEVFKYSGDADDKQWLYENHHMPATGGKAYMLLVEDVQELADTDEYRDNPGLLLHELVGFAIPEWMLTKMRAQMDALRTDQPKVVKPPIKPRNILTTGLLMHAGPLADEETRDADDDLDTTSQVNLRLPFASLADATKTVPAGNGEASNTGSLDLLSAADDDTEAVSPFPLISGSFEDAEGSPMAHLGSPAVSDLEDSAPLSAPFQVS